MNFGRENFGHSSIVSKVVEPAQIVPDPDPSIAGIQSSTSTSKQLLEPLISPESAERVLAVLKSNPDIKQRSTQHQQIVQQWQMLLNEGIITENHTIRPKQLLPNPDPSVVDMQNSKSASKKLLEALSSASPQQQFQVLPSMKANPEFMAAQLIKHYEVVFQRHQLFLQHFQQRRQLLQQEPQQLLQRPQQRLHQRQQRRQLVIRHNVAGYSTMRPHRVLPNRDPSTATRQKPTEALPQILETLKALNLE